MNNDEIKDNKDKPWIPTTEELKGLKEDLDQIIEHDTQLLLKSRQEETLNNLKKYNEGRKTKIVDEVVTGSWKDAKGVLQGLSDEPVEDTIRRNRDIPRGERPYRFEPDKEPERIDEPEEILEDDGQPMWATKPNVAFDLAKFDDDDYASEDDPEELEAETLIVGDSVNPVMERQITPICEYCGSLAYPGQLHGLGYCREKIKYEQ